MSLCAPPKGIAIGRVLSCLRAIILILLAALFGNRGTQRFIDTTCVLEVFHNDGHVTVNVDQPAPHTHAAASTTLQLFRAGSPSTLLLGQYTIGGSSAYLQTSGSSGSTFTFTPVSGVCNRGQ